MKNEIFYCHVKTPTSYGPAICDRSAFRIPFPHFCGGCSVATQHIKTEINTFVSKQPPATIGKQSIDSRLGKSASGYVESVDGEPLFLIFVSNGVSQPNVYSSPTEEE